LGDSELRFSAARALFVFACGGRREGRIPPTAVVEGIRS